MSKKRKPRKQKTTTDASSGPSPVPKKASPSDSKIENPIEPATPSDPAEQKQSQISRYVSFGLLLGVIVIVGVLFYEVMAQFVVPLFLAALLVVIFRPLHRWIQEKCGGRERLSALLTTASVLLVVLIPIGVLLVMAAAEGRHVYQQFNATKIVEGFHQIRTNLKLDMPSKGEIRLIENELSELQQGISITSEDEDQHQLALYEIQEAARTLAEAQGLDWPTKPEVSDPNASDWELFVLDLADARSLHGQIPLSSEKEKISDERNETLHNYQVKLNDTAAHFAAFRTEFLGGKAKAWVVELVNPSDNTSESYASSVVSFSRDKLFRIGGAGVSFIGSLLIGSAIMVIGLYFFLLDGPKMIETFKGLSPIDDEHEQELVAEFSNVSRAVVLATLLSAMAQGFLAGIGFYFAGLDSVFLLTVLSAVLAMVPFVGAAAVWFPCCLYLYFVDNNLAAAIGLGIYGAGIVSMADNVIKPLVLHGQSNIHPLFALLSVLGGVSTLGPIGILVGPMVVAFLQTLLEMLRREMTDMDRMANESSTG